MCITRMVIPRSWDINLFEQNSCFILITVLYFFVSLEFYEDFIPIHKDLSAFVHLLSLKLVNSGYTANFLKSYENRRAAHFKWRMCSWLLGQILPFSNECFPKCTIAKFPFYTVANFFSDFTVLLSTSGLQRQKNVHLLAIISVLLPYSRAGSNQLKH